MKTSQDSAWHKASTPGLTAAVIIVTIVITIMMIVMIFSFYYCCYNYSVLKTEIVIHFLLLDTSERWVCGC